MQLTLADVGALVAAAVTLAGLLLGIYRFRAGRPRLRVMFSFAYPMLPDQGPEEFLNIKAANVGDGPMFLISAGLRLSNRKTMTVLPRYWWADGFPAQLPPGQSHNSYLKRSDVDEDLQREANDLGRPVRIVAAFYRDATEKEWTTRVRAKLVWRPDR